MSYDRHVEPPKRKRPARRVTLAHVYGAVLELTAAVNSESLRIEGRFEAVDRRLEAFEYATNRKFDRVDVRFDEMNARFDEMNGRFDRLEQRVERLELRPA